MKRKVSAKKYLLAFILTLIVFAGGIFIGLLFENMRLNHSKQTILSEKVALQSLQLQQKYIDSGLADCKSLNQLIDTNTNELGRKMAEVVDYEQKSVFSEEEFELQLQDYFLTQIQFLLIAQEIDKKCAKDSVKIVYFFDENKYDTQGDILAYIKKTFGSRVLIFALNSNFKQEPMINILLTSYKIAAFPSVVVEDKVYQEHIPLEKMMKIVCAEFRKMGSDVPEECERK